MARVVGQGAEAGDYAAAIESEAMWRALAARPSTQHIARSEVVKVIVDRTDGAVYFLESKKWPVHFFFAARYLDRPSHPIPDQAVFNRTEYSMAPALPFFVVTCVSAAGAIAYAIGARPTLKAA